MRGLKLILHPFFIILLAVIAAIVFKSSYAPKSDVLSLLNPKKIPDDVYNARNQMAHRENLLEGELNHVLKEAPEQAQKSTAPQFSSAFRETTDGTVKGTVYVELYSNELNQSPTKTVSYLCDQLNSLKNRTFSAKEQTANFLMKVSDDTQVVMTFEMPYDQIKKTKWDEYRNAKIFFDYTKGRSKVWFHSSISEANQLAKSP